MAKVKAFFAQESPGKFNFYVEFQHDANGHTSSNAWTVNCGEESHPKHTVYSIDGLFRVMEQHEN